MRAASAVERNAVVCSRLEVADVVCTKSSTVLLWTEPAGGAGTSAERAIILHAVFLPELSRTEGGSAVCDNFESRRDDKPSDVKDDDINKDASKIAISAAVDR
jgi:hypothetical protein